jgi:hypothetical protein
MTFPFQSTGHHHAVSTLLKGPQGEQHIELTCAWQLDDLDGCRILET